MHASILTKVFIALTINTAMIVVFVNAVWFGGTHDDMDQLWWSQVTAAKTVQCIPF